MKKFYRSRNDQVIAGVAGGLAEYFDVDPMLTRLVCFGLLFTGGFLFVYIAAWIFVPEAPVEPKV